MRFPAVSRTLSRAYVSGEERRLARRAHRLDENLGAVNVALTRDDLRAIDGAAAKITVEGARLPESVLRFSNR